jgi:predicted permease
MNWLPEIVRRRRLYDELADEMRLHLEERTEQLMSEGMSRNEAEQAARRAFGNRTVLEERSREVWQWPLFESIWADVRYAVRQLRKSPGFTAVALLTLALGVGSNTSIFSLVNGLLLRPLPVPNAGQLTVLRRDEDGVEPRYSFSAPFFRGLEAQHEAFSDVFAYYELTMQVHGSSGNEAMQGMLVSGEFFSGLSTPPFMGRYLTPQDDRTGGNPAGFAVVISNQFWERWFGSAPDVIGRPLRIANTAFTVVGVTPKGFSGADPLRIPDLYVPLAAEPIIDAPASMIAFGYDARWLTLMARLRSGVSLEKANAELLTISGPILRQVPNPHTVAEGEKNHLHFAAEPGSRGFTYIRALFRKPLVAVFSMCGALLLLACLNVAGLLLARSAARERELATRLGLGATRFRLIRQLMVESLLIAALGTAAGLAASPLVSRSLAALLMSGTPNLHLDSSLDMRVFAFAALTAIVVALAMGLVPAMRATASNLNEAMKNGQQTQSTRPRHNLLPRILLASEVSLALMLVVGAGLLATSLTRLQHSGVGFEPKGLVKIAFSMDKQPLTGAALRQLYRQIAEGLRTQPGVKSVSFQLVELFTGGGWDGNYAVQGQTENRLYLNSVGPSYFAAMRIPVLNGTEFGWNDNANPRIILNQAAAQLLFPGQNPVGKYIIRPRDKTVLEVVAVVGNAKYDDVRTSPPATGYVPIMGPDSGQDKPSYSALVRVEGPVVPLAAAARKLAAQLAPDIPAPLVTSMDQELKDSISAERMMALLAAFFAVCALLVTAIGLYGTLAYATARRTKEIGIRLALGARRGQVVGLVFRENIWVAACGSFAGLAVALQASRALASFLYGTSVHDPWVLVGSVATLSVVASAASILPALRAARTEPMLALRIE